MNSSVKPAAQSSLNHEDIRIGTLQTIPELISLGFESFSLVFGKGIKDFDLPKLADELSYLLENSNAVISSLGVYGNSLGSSESDKITLSTWHELIENADKFNCDIVAGFTGRIPYRPIPESIDSFVETFSPLAEKAGKKEVRLAFENCSMGGNWNRGILNIAHGPDAWELMFTSLRFENIGLQWEPCHQMIQLIDPLPQIETWKDRLFHIHGKDATIRWDKLRYHGVSGKQSFCWHRTPGFGDSNWTEIISELRRNGFQGSIDIEGWHDPVYKNELEMTGQNRALNYLKQCRGGIFTEINS